MRILAAMTTLVVALLAMPAWSQVPPEDQRTTLQQQVEERERQDQERRENAAAVEKAYQRQIRSSGSGQVPKTDPWGNIRDAAPAKNPQSKN
jgi:cytochrome c-type biogenesis protein CcmH/NrfG